MASLILIIACVGLIIYRIYKYMFYKPDNFPPGPPRLPLLGSYPFMLMLNYKHLHKAIDWLCKYYETDVLGLYAATFPTIVAHSAKTVKECLNNHDIDGKSQLLLAKMRDPEFKVRGIFFTGGAFWQEQRRFLLRNLRDYGFGRRFNELELDINNEISSFIDLLKNGPKFDHEKKYMKDGNVLCPNIFTATFGNFFFKVLINERFSREKQHLLFGASESALIFMKNGDNWGRIFSYVEMIAHLFPIWSDYRLLKKSSEDLYNCVKAIIDDQHKTYDANHERHFLDLYFKKIEEATNEQESSFCYKQLILLCTDILQPALNANALTLQFLLQRLHFQPKILKKCQDEIELVVGQGRLPSLDDRINLPYMEATLRETMRHETLVPSGISHVATVDTKFMGYNIPENTVVFASLNACNHDESAWNQPEIFNPNRFLDENGKLSLTLDKSLPFGAGRRVCAGETFSRNTLFLMTSALIQNFNFIVPDGKQMPATNETTTGIVTATPEYWLRFEYR